MRRHILQLAAGLIVVAALAPSPAHETVHQAPVVTSVTPSVRWDVLEQTIDAQRRWYAAAASRPVTTTLPARPTVVDGTVWDELAGCEASGDWAANTGNGFEGGPQFTHSTWVAYGGREFAEHAYLASRNEQITVADRVRRGQGWGAWPACARKLGLR